MPNSMQNDDNQNLIEQTNLTELSDVLKALSHRHRIKILLLLLEKPIEFDFLLKVLKIKKTALANHLAILKQNNLVEHRKKGVYLLSAKGFIFMKSIIKAEKKNSIFERNDSISSYLAITSFFNNHPLELNFVKNQPKYVTSWLSYLGSVLGLLKSFGSDYTLEDIGGYSGYSFRIVMDKYSTHVAGPTAGPFWDEIYTGTEQLVGKKLNVLFKPGAIFPHDQLTIEEGDLISEALNEIKIQINKNNPVILWGIKDPEFGIVYGYHNETIFASTYANSDSENISVFNLRDIVSPSGIWLMYFDFESNLKLNKSSLELLALKRAVKMIEGTKSITTEEAWEKVENKWYGKEITFICGLDALTQWATILESGTNEQFNYDGNAYCGECYCEGMKLSSQFLKKISKRFADKKISQILEESALFYDKAYLNMKRFTELFPFLSQREITEVEKHMGSKFINECRKNVEKSLQLIKQCINSLY